MHNAATHELHHIESLNQTHKDLHTVNTAIFLETLKIEKSENELACEKALKISGRVNEEKSC